MIDIIYEDNHILVVTKPVNIPVQADISGDRDLLSELKADIKKRCNKPGNVFLGLVHRLDRPVGGVMVFAKTSKSASRLSDMIRRRAFGKEYLAVVRGKPARKSARLVDYLVKDKKRNIVQVVKEKSGAMEASLRYEVLDSRNGLSLLRVVLETGRPHQIRVQLANMGTPIFGDQRYGKGVNKPGQQIALWANTLTFSHPTTKEEMSFTSNPPERSPWDLFSGTI